MWWILLVFISIFTFSIASILQRVLSQKKENDPIAAAIIFQFLTAAVIFCFALFYGFKLPDLKPLVLNLTIMTVFYAAFNVLLFKAYQTTEASEVSILLSTRVFWAVFTAIIFLGEGLNLQRIIGILLVIAGVIVVNYRKTKWHFHKGYLLVLLAAFFFGTAFTNDAFLLKHFNTPSYLTVSFSLPPLLLSIVYPKSFLKIPSLLNFKIFSKLLMMSILWGAAAIAIFMAYQSGGKVTQIMPISQLSIVVTIVLAFVFLKERDHLWQKTFGAVVMLLGVWLLL